MTVTFKPCKLSGIIDAPPSKSMAHRYLIGAALSGQKCRLEGIDFSEDILATIDCLIALGANITLDKNSVSISPEGFMKGRSPLLLNCRESGSTLRFLIPLALCLNKSVTFFGSERLLERPLDVYEKLCRERGFVFLKEKNSLTVSGNLQSKSYRIRGNVSSQFISGLIMALVYLGGEASIEIEPPFESKSYVDLTISALGDFGADVIFSDEYRIEVKKSKMKAFFGKIEGDYSNAAFVDAFNFISSSVEVNNLNSESLQGDRVYRQYFDLISKGTPTLDISDCPDLGPILIALAALKNGATFTGTSRLKAKESDRGAAMQKELEKLGGGLIFTDNTITVPKQELKYRAQALCGHNDHRIVMALSVILSKTGGSICGAEAVKKSYPGFFEDLKKLGAEVSIK